MTPEHEAHHGKRQGIVLSGGGALGAFEVGVMRALFERRSPSLDHRPVRPDIYVGTSVGAYNAGFLASRGHLPDLEALQELEQVWRTELATLLRNCGTDAYRLRTAPFSLDPGCLARPWRQFVLGIGDAVHWGAYVGARSAAFLTSSEPLAARVLESINLASLLSPTPLYRLIRRTIGLEDLRSSQRALSVATTNWVDGTLVIFNKLDIVEHVGHPAFDASSAVPGVFPPVDIDGIAHVDGGVLLNTPIKPAIEDGAEVVHVIYLDPGIANLPIPRVPNTLDTIYRAFAIQQCQNFDEDIKAATEINLDLISLRERGVLSRDFRLMLRSGAPESDVVERIASGRRPFRPVIIHRYRPRASLAKTAGFFDFRPEVIDELIHRGYLNAVHHDCALEGCSIPTEQQLLDARGTPDA